jgi:glycosyltransferase involved in cell wall biosynthesis
MALDLASMEREGAQRVQGGSQRPLRVLVWASTFPSSIQPIHGVFVKERVRALARQHHCDVRVISPVPYFPPWRQFPRWYPFSQVPRRETLDGLVVDRPRYVLIPKIGVAAHARLMYLGARREVARLRRTFDFDLVDAHFVYPDGVAAACVARKYCKPLVMTARGEDMTRFPNIPAVRGQIARALRQATQLVALSQELADRMAALGADPARITVISNGVDTQKYKPQPMEEARAKLALPANGPIVLCVGYLLRRKGFHLVVDAMAKVRLQHPRAMLLIVGGVARWGEDYSSVIRERISAHGLESSVRLIGPRPPEELSAWYSAADLFVLGSSSEGSPNVLMEALACGVPAVATPVGSVPQVLTDRSLGILLREQTADEMARGIDQALSASWDRAAIREWAVAHSWNRTADHVDAVLRKAVDEFEGHSAR